MLSHLFFILSRGFFNRFLNAVNRRSTAREGCGGVFLGVCVCVACVCVARVGWGVVWGTRCGVARVGGCGVARVGWGGMMGTILDGNVMSDSGA